MALRRYTILMAVGIAVALLGTGVLAAGAPPSTHTGVIALTATPNYYMRQQLDVFTGGAITVTFSVTSGGTFNVWVMTAAQHAAFIATGALAYLAADSGSSGTFSTALPSGGTYFVETGHGAGYENQAETGIVSSVVDAWMAGPVQVGIGILVFAAILVAIGLYYRAKPERPPGAPTPPPYMPAQYPPYAAYPPGTVPAAAAWSTGGPPSAGGGTILVTLDNQSSLDESVQILIDGAPAVSLTVPARTSGQAHLHAPAASPGATVHVETVTARGSRASQDVPLGPDGTAQVILRLA